jgi:hypothetical protein
MCVSIVVFEAGLIIVYAIIILMEKYQTKEGGISRACGTHRRKGECMVYEDLKAGSHYSPFAETRESS